MKPSRNRGYAQTQDRERPSGFVGTCVICGKRCFLTKRDARRAARTFGGPRNAYRCGRYWHLGHLPNVVKRGKLARTEIKPNPKRSIEK